MREQLRNRDFFFACGREFRPVLRDWFLQIQPSLHNQAGNARRHGAFGGGPDVHQSVFLPGLCLCAIAVTAPDIHNLLALVIHTDSSTDLLLLLEIGREDIAQLVKGRCNLAVNHWH